MVGLWLWLHRLCLQEIEASLKKIEDLKAVITEQGEAVQQLQKGGRAQSPQQLWPLGKR